MRNLSTLGARLSVASVVGIPETFDLMTGQGDHRACRVVWRTANELGIEFGDG